MNKFIVTVTFLIISVPTFGKVQKLDLKNSDVFRSWFVRIIEEQLRQGPSPKWVQRDCVGLVRYSVNESLKTKDSKWMHSHGFANSPTPPTLTIDDELRDKLNNWTQYDGKSKGRYISAIGLVQGNTTFISKDINQVRPGDILFYDMQDSQHIMIWMGKYVAYHTGTVSKEDNGLRKVKYSELINWKDSRWRPTEGNPNFIGIFKLGFLSR
jgi:uncharacterized protein YfaT (DUF1175 family)